MSGIPEFLREEGVTTIEVRDLSTLYGFTFHRPHDRGTKLVISNKLTAVGKLVTLIHEYLHAKHPEWTEEQIMNDEEQLLFILSIDPSDTHNKLPKNID